MTTNGQYYSDTGGEFIARARTYLAGDDLLQASEKGWGAAAHTTRGPGAGPLVAFVMERTPRRRGTMRP